MKEIQASDLRPLAVLEDTLNYLMKLLDSPDHSFLVLHDFIFDRTRSIRQDLSMQNINDGQVICMYEKIVSHIIYMLRVKVYNYTYRTLSFMCIKNTRKGLEHQNGNFPLYVFLSMDIIIT